MQPSPARGTVIGHYRLEAVLGRGGMGVVYRAADARLGRKVALKVLPPEYGGDRAFRTRFLRESRLAASIDHQGVIPIYEAGEAGGHLFIAMRYVEGTDLGELLRREGALEPGRALALVAQLGAALDAAHARGLVHRDVKPSNALVVRQGEAEHVYLSDFGLSREVAGDATLSASGGVVGTVSYMAPEVIRSGQADARSDLYSLGCLLFECLTGAAPFPGPSEATVIYGHLEEPPPRASDRRPGLPRALDAVLARALDKDPDRRWASGAELAGAARAALAGEGPRATDPIRRRAVVVGLAVVALAGGVVLAGDPGSGPGVASVRANGVAVIDPGEPALTGQVALDGAPSGIAAGAGAVWVSDEDRDFVSRLDKETFTIRQTIQVGHGPSAIAVGRDRVWVANRQDGTVSAISAQTNTVVDKKHVGRTVEGVCVGSGAVWVASPTDYAVVRLDPESLHKTATVRLDTQPAELACGAGVVWASSPSSGVVTEISAKAAAEVTTIPVGRGASAVAVGADAVWVANASDGMVSRIDPQRAVVTTIIELGVDDGPADLAVTKEAVWVSNELGGTVVRIDPARPQDGVAKKLPVGNRPQGLALVDGALWVGVADTGARHRGGTLRLEYRLKMPWKELDPASSYSAEGLELLALTNDGLTAFRHQGGAGGATLEPNLAVALPTPSDGGRRYAFRLRRGIRYSTGQPVRATDVRFALERALRNHEGAPGLFASIRGARACTPERCDLSRGIVADDATGTVEFRLTERDGDLLTKLAVPLAAVLPPSVGVAAPAKRALPATGPYLIAEFRPRRFVRLQRNPRFKTWSRAARPDGYPDAITVHLGASGKAAIERVLTERADRIGAVDGLPGQLPALRRRVPAQLPSSVVPTTFYFVLNTRRAPFDSREARRAVAFAFDRRAAVAAAGGRDVAQENCQILPPSFFGSRQYCPYTTGTGGARGRPDLARARRLVRRSGTHGMRVTVVVGESFLPYGVNQQMKRTLQQLGYRATLRVLPDDRYIRALFDTSKRSQIGLVPWGADYPAASNFLHSFSCDALIPNSPKNLNAAQFCDPEFDRRMAEAARLQAPEPDAADALWARAERRIIDEAPAVGAYSNINTDLVSERLGNYQYNFFAGGMLLDQAWVR